MSNLSPIYHLNLDILWRVFSMNAGLYWTTRTNFMDKSQRALSVLHRSSQVCRRWRQIILGSPALWGMVFELDLLAQDDNRWRKLMMDRAKNSRLCINGTIRGGHPGSRAFFVNLLHNHWPRIRRFDVFVEDHYLFEPETWDVFQRPALQLEIFKLYFEKEESAIFSISDHPIFSNNAPVLREFMFPDTSSTTSLFFLKHINPSPGASLVLLTEEHVDTHGTLPDQVIDDLCTQISRYTENYFSRNYALARSIFVKIGPPTFSFKVRKTADELVPMPFQNDFRIGVFSNHLPQYAVPKMVASLNPRRFTHTIRLEFIPYMIDIIEDVQPTLTSLLQALDAVKVMMTSENGIKAFLNAQSEHPDILPLMDTFWLKYVEPTTDQFPKLLLDFLRGRLRASKPITTINISDSFYQFKEKLDWGYLEEIDGLRVILRQDAKIVEEYVCGTGTPEILDMRSRDL
ncbi:hypothetical protein CVT25_001558 [Psilocybe cyanescens]|uniref:F-box domain-containing protein n=1 Tax=Psilocybe cyanescens TaxID=93625 RepID=A0A409WQ18_PSICY|nr:hypothetical protein CVT25_001558 [Psilocybe cyanescens]